uniref:nucleoside-diphosphate kinase n=1 Tax=Podarcis muralis TaxID=64176 RepID=A0A670ICE2_PODMU
MASVAERTFIAIKPDGVQRGLVGEIIKRFERKGFKLVAMKFMHASEDLLSEHYSDLKDRPFFAGLVKYMHSGPVVAMVWQGLNVVKTGRVMLGETNPADSKPGTIRGDFCVQVGSRTSDGASMASDWLQELPAANQKPHFSFETFWKSNRLPEQIPFDFQGTTVFLKRHLECKLIVMT